MSETYISDWTKKNPSIIALYLHEHQFICVLVFCVFVYLHWLCLYFVSILYSWLGHLQIAGNRSAHAALSINLSPPLSQRRSCRKQPPHHCHHPQSASQGKRQCDRLGMSELSIKLQQWSWNNFKMLRVCKYIFLSLCWDRSVVYAAFCHLIYIKTKKTFFN